MTTHFPPIGSPADGRSLARSIFILTLAHASCALAQPFEFPDPGSAPRDKGSRPPITLQVDYASIGSSKAEFRGQDGDASGAESVSIGLEGMVPLNAPTWMMPLGLVAHRVNFDRVTGAPVPESVDTLRLTTGLGYRLNEEWMFMARLSPTLYRTHDVTSRDVGLSGGLMALWRYRPDLTWMFGMMADPDGEFPVLPALGANWAINRELTLSLMVPRPQIIYRPNGQWRFHAGASLDGATFRTSETFGAERNEPRYNRALASYRDVRVGAGFDVRVTPKLSIQAEAGYSVDRRIEYTRIDERVKFGSAPFVHAGLRLAF